MMNRVHTERRANHSPSVLLSHGWRVRLRVRTEHRTNQWLPLSLSLSRQWRFCLPDFMTRYLAIWMVVCMALLLAGCSKGYGNGWDWERMRKQKRADPFGATPVFPDGKVLQTPPAGTIPIDAIVGNSALTEGMSAGVVVSDIPLPVDSALLAEGADRFGIFCTPCHGDRGAGGGTVGVNLRPYEPPVLVSPMVAGTPVGALYHVITHGGARMPAFAAQLNVRQRWAVVAYLESLQSSAPAAAVDSAGGSKPEGKP